MSYVNLNKIDPFVSVTRGDVPSTDDEQNPITIENHIISASVDNALSGYLYRVSYYNSTSGVWNIQRFRENDSNYEVAITGFIWEIEKNKGYRSVRIPLNKGEVLNIGIDTTNMPPLIFSSTRATNRGGTHCVNPIHYNYVNNMYPIALWKKYFDRVVPSTRTVVNIPDSVRYSVIPIVDGELDLNFIAISNMDDFRTSPASTIKMVTAILAKKYNTNLQEKLTVTQEDLTIGSGYNLAVGDEITFEDCIYNLMLPSSNTSATLLARITGDKIKPNGGVSAFVAEMNSLLKSKGIENTNCINPDGNAASNQYTTCVDLAKITMIFTEDEFLSEVWNTPEKIIPITNGTNTKSIYLTNTSPVVNDISFKGSKTGSLGTMQNIVAVMSLSNNTQVVISLMGSSNRENDLDQLAVLASQYLTFPVTRELGYVNNYENT